MEKMKVHNSENADVLKRIDHLESYVVDQVFVPLLKILEVALSAVIAFGFTRSVVMKFIMVNVEELFIAVVIYVASLLITWLVAHSILKRYLKR